MTLDSPCKYNKFSSHFLCSFPSSPILPLISNPLPLQSSFPSNPPILPPPWNIPFPSNPEFPTHLVYEAPEDHARLFRDLSLPTIHAQRYLYTLNCTKSLQLVQILHIKKMMHAYNAILIAAGICVLKAQPVHVYFQYSEGMQLWLAIIYSWLTILVHT